MTVNEITNIGEAFIGDDAVPWHPDQLMTIERRFLILELDHCALDDPEDQHDHCRENQAGLDDGDDRFDEQDPEFDPEQSAFYYARVLEIPTPRWTAYDAKRFGVKMPANVPMVGHDRAYTSPIWYTPGT